LNFTSVHAQSFVDEDIFNNCIQRSIQNKKCSVTDIALNFIGKPYRAKTLEINSSEKLVVNLREFDCSTFVESVMAIFLTLKEQKTNFGAFKQNLSNIRYRNGIIEGYASRLHYASDWIRDNCKKGIIEIVSHDAGKKISFKLNYMSTHPELYPALKTNPSAVEEIKKIEIEVGKTDFFYVSKHNLSSIENKIRQGDIIFFVTSLAGLDISHLGIAYRTNNVLTFIHASQRSKKVIVNPGTLADYCMNINSNKGIIICKIN
jgi:hypothetical protein